MICRACGFQDRGLYGRRRPECWSGDIMHGRTPFEKAVARQRTFVKSLLNSSIDFELLAEMIQRQRRLV